MTYNLKFEAHGRFCHLNVAVCEVMSCQRVCVDSVQSCMEMKSKTNTISHFKRKHRAKRRAEAERWHAARRHSSDETTNKLAPERKGSF